MVVVSNTTPIISLAKIRMLHILENIFGEVIVSKGVYDELTVKNAFHDEIEYIKECKFLRVKKVNNEFAIRLMQKQLGLDLGESESIVLASEIKSDLLIMDEKKGRNVAKIMDLNLTGTLGILVQAKRIGMISELKPLLDLLIKNNIRISEKLYNSILKSVNEK